MLNQMKTVLLMGALTAVVLAAGQAFAPGASALFVVGAMLMNLGMYFFSDKLVLRMHHARPLEAHELPWLHQATAELSAAAGIPMPRLYLIPDSQPNAFATGRNPRHGVVAVTEGILRTLTQRELRGVIAHELAHIRNRDILIATLAAGMAAAVSWIANALQFSMIFGGGSQDEDGPSPIASLAFALLAPIAATLVQLAISRSREFVADATAARLTGDPESLARALEGLSRGAALMPAAAQPATASLFIVNPFAGAGGLMKLFSTHPPMEERVRRLRQMVQRAA